MRLLFISASGILHGSLAVSLLMTHAGHAAPTPDLPVVAVVSVMDEVPAPPVEPLLEPVPNAVAASHASLPTHHHDYPVPFDHDAHPHDPSLHHTALPIAAPDGIEPPTEAEHVHAEPVAPVFKLGPVGGDDHDHDHAHTGTGGGTATGPATYAESGVTTRAALRASAPATYPPAARVQEIEADVPVEIVVDPTGRVVDAHVVQHAGFGFDESALAAIRAYQFTPATRNGEAVRVRMRWSVVFRLH